MEEEQQHKQPQQQQQQHQKQEQQNPKIQTPDLNQQNPQLQKTEPKQVTNQKEPQQQQPQQQHQQPQLQPQKQPKQQQHTKKQKISGQVQPQQLKKLNPQATTIQKQQQQQKQQKKNESLSKIVVLDGVSLESIRKRILESDISSALQAITDIRDRIEIVHTTAYPSILTSLLPAFSSLLSIKTRPNADIESIEDRIRRIVLEIVSRFPHNEILRPHAATVLNMAMDVVSNDYEENALIASRIIFDLHKTYRPMLCDHVQPLLDFVHNAYRLLPITVQKNYMEMKNKDENLVDQQQQGPSSSSFHTAPPQQNTQQTPTPSLPGSKVAASMNLKSLSSFRVLTECPLSVMLLFQLYPKYITVNIPTIIPLMMDALALRPPSQKQTKNHTSLYVTRCRELLACQVKTLSFLTYLFRGFTEQLKSYEEKIAINVISLLKTCPLRDTTTSTRKELLVATRHIIATDFRKGLYRHLDVLLDERVMVGSHYHNRQHSCSSSDQPQVVLIRSLGYSALADLVHHVRTTLSMSQASRVIHIFSRVIHDPSLPLTIQTTSVRLLLNLVDHIYHNKDPNPKIAQDLLWRIMNTLVNKFETLVEYIPIVKKAEDRKKEETALLERSCLFQLEKTRKRSSSHDDEADVTQPSVRTPKKRNLLLGGLSDMTTTMDSLHDVRSLVKPMALGLKTLIWCVSNYRRRKEEEVKSSSVSAATNKIAKDKASLYVLTNSELDVVGKYLEYGLTCFSLLYKNKEDSSASFFDMLETFAACFTVLDSFSFHLSIGPRILSIYNAMMVDIDFFGMFPRSLLWNTSVSYDFADVLLGFLMDRLDALAVPIRSDVDAIFDIDSAVSPLPSNMKENQSFSTKTEPVKTTALLSIESISNKSASVILHLFKLIFQCMTIYPDNEAILRPHLQTLVATCLCSANKSSQCHPGVHYYSLLRSLFRTISGGKFEQSYKELLPLLPTILNGLFRVFSTTEDVYVRSAIVELCLSIPARLSSLLPHLPLLLRLILPALQSPNGDLVNLGLRTLEFWVDNLNPDFLFPILSQQSVILKDVMISLCNHLRPAPYPYGLLSLRLLGKLGGKNRRFLSCMMDTPLEDGWDVAALNIKCTWTRSKDVLEGDPNVLGKDKMNIDNVDNNIKDDLRKIEETNDRLVDHFALPLDDAIVSAVAVLKRVACAPKLIASSSQDDASSKSKNELDSSQDDFPSTCDQVVKTKMEFVNLTEHSIRIMENTKLQQSKAAFSLLRGALASIIEIPADTFISYTIERQQQSTKAVDGNDLTDTIMDACSSRSKKHQEYIFHKICEGLVYASLHKELNKDASTLLHGLATHCLLSICSHVPYIFRVDAAGNVISDCYGAKENPDQGSSNAASSNIPTPAAAVTRDFHVNLGPFGSFQFRGGPLNNIQGNNPLTFCDVIVSLLSRDDVQVRSIVLNVVSSLMETATTLKVDDSSDDTKFPLGCNFFFEYFLRCLCEACFTQAWNLRKGLYQCVLLLCTTFGRNWTRQYELEIIHTALFVVNSSPKEIGCAIEDGLKFFFHVFGFIYGYNCKAKAEMLDCCKNVWKDGLVVGNLTSGSSKPLSSCAEGCCKDNNEQLDIFKPSNSVIQMLVGELTSSKFIVRLVARISLQQISHYCIATNEMTKTPYFPMEFIVNNHITFIKRHLFSRSLRILPLPVQIGIIETLSFFVDKAPTLIPLSDTSMLAFLSELLKMSSIADGEMVDKNGDNVIVIDKNGHASGGSSSNSSASYHNAGQQQQQKLGNHASSTFLMKDMELPLFAGKIQVEIPGELPQGIQLRVASLMLMCGIIRRNRDSFFDANSSTQIGNIRPHVISLLFRSLVSIPPQAVTISYSVLKDILPSDSNNSDTSKLDTTSNNQRLPKELLQACIRPVLLNLRDYTKLTVPLLRGLSCLLSLLSSWFSKTLGGKLLDHLQKWTEPERIMSLQAWREGEEVLVAAAIVDLFALLPDASSFTEALVKAVINLEAVLPRYKLTSSSITSPFRAPLSRFLNQCGKAAIIFFLHEQRLMNQEYSNLFYDILKRKDSDILRSYFTSAECTTSLLNICFERPLAIIRAEKAASKSATPRNTNDILSLHGISEASTFVKSDSNEKRQQASKETNINAPKRMTVDTLELQYQGLRLIALLMTNDPTYVQENNHPDVVMAYRWLWRSKGRHLRLLHEESIPLKYQGESKMIAEFLMTYSKHHPSDIDVLYELLRIYLQSSSMDFTFVQKFLEYMILHVLSKKDKQKSLLRFFDVLAAEGTEETKVLSIQLIILPILRSDLEIIPYTSELEKGQAPSSGSYILELKDCRSENSIENYVENDSKILDSELNAVSSTLVETAPSSPSEYPFPDISIDANFIRKFIKEALVHNISSVDVTRGFGEKLQIELLKVSTLMIEFLWPQMVDHRKELIKFAWNLLKSDESSSKLWAYVNCCRFIQCFETPSKIILQVYVALLRVWQPESRDLVTFALKILFPALPYRLPKEDFLKAIKWTKKIMYEECHSTPQLTHLLHVVVAHPQFFFPYRDHFVPYMVNSLNRLGLPPNQPENRALSIAVADLILSWEKYYLKVKSLTAKETKEKPSILYIVDHSENTPDNVDDPTASSPVIKKSKNSDGESSAKVRGPVEGSESRLKEEGSFQLNQTLVDIIVNFLVRICLLTSDSKLDGDHRLQKRSVDLFRRALDMSWESVILRPIYFEKVFSMCTSSEESVQNDSTSIYINSSDKKSKDKMGKIGKGGSTKPSSKPPGTGWNKHTTTKSAAIPTSSDPKEQDASTSIPLPLLLTCLDLFITLLECAPKNNFITDNCSKVMEILSACFNHSSEIGGEMQVKLKLFIFLVFSIDHRKTSFPLLNHLKVLMELSLATSDESNTNDLTGIKSGKPINIICTSTSIENNNSDLKENKTTCDEDDPKVRSTDVGTATEIFQSFFILQLLEDIDETCPDFIENFSSSLLCLAQKLTKNHIQNVVLNSKCMNSIQSRGNGLQQVLSTPVLGIMEEACSPTNQLTCIESIFGREHKEVAHVSLTTLIKSLISCIRLIGSSSVPYSFTKARKSYFQLLSNILDLSDNIPLLITVVGILGNWMISGGGPMTHKERNSFLWKMTAFDNRVNAMPEAPSQALVSIVSRMVISLHNTCKNTIKVDSKGSDMLLGRSLMASLLCADSCVRTQLFELYGTFEKKQNNIKFEKNKSSDIAGLLDRSPVDVLWQLLHSDWEGLGMRLWILVFVECFILTAHHEGGVLSTISDTMQRATKNKMSNSCLNQNKRDSSISSNPTLQIIGPTFICKKEHESNFPDKQISVEVLGSEFSRFFNILKLEKSSSNFGMGRVLSALRELSHGNVFLCQSLFQKILCSAWERLPSNNTRMILITAIESLLARPFHAQFLQESFSLSHINNAPPCENLHPKRNINVIQIFLRSLQKLTPMPCLDTDLLISLANNYNAWFEVLIMLEFQNNTLSEVKDYAAIKSKIHFAIRRCYEELKETNLCLALGIQTCTWPETRRAISCDIHGRVSTALESYINLVSRLEKKCQGKANSIKDDVCWPTPLEASLWEERWLVLNRELCQWSVLNDYANATSDTKLLMEVAWKSRNWDGVRKLCCLPSAVAAMEDGDPESKILEIFLAIADGKLNEVEHLHAQTAQLFLHKWQLLPRFWCGSHANLLHCFHRVVELRESGQIMVEVNAHASQRTFPDLKNLLSAWRDRLPNECESISAWEDLLLWRSHMFSAITANFSWSEPGTLATLQDRPWTSIRMAKTARKKDLREVSLMSLSKLTDCAMDVTDAFSKLREQIMVYHDSDSQMERTGGLNLVNTTNLSFFDANQKSELFRLKASFLSSLGFKKKANQTYCQAVQICPSYGRAWLDWGTLCSSLADLAEEQDSASKMKKVAQYLAQAMGCYFEAIQCEPHERHCAQLSRCLWMIQKDGNVPGILCQTLETRGATLPEWVWLPWIPQLLTSLVRIEAKAVRSILNGIVAKYPQSVYYALRAFYLERRDVERSHKQPGNVPSSNTSPSVSHAEELMSTLRRTHPTLWSALEAILEELIIKFRPSLEEDLLGTIKALLQRVNTQLEIGETGNSVLEGFSKTLSRVSTKFFRPPSSLSSDSMDNRSKKTHEFNTRYKNRFEKDFMLEHKDTDFKTDTTPCSLSLVDISKKLENWQNLLQVRVSSTSSSFPLQQASFSMSRIFNQSPDLWAGACDPAPFKSRPSTARDIDPTPEGTLSSPTSSATAAIAASKAAALAVAEAAFSEGGGGHLGGFSSIIEIPGQYAPNSTDFMDSSPAVELHAKLVRFDPIVEVIRRNEGQQLLRRVGMVGSDGRTHFFLLQFAIPYVTRTDERTAQLHYLMAKMIRRGLLTSKMNVYSHPIAVIPIAQRLRMTADDKHYYSLDDIYRLDRQAKGLKHDDPLLFLKNETRKLIEEMKLSSTPEKTDDNFTQALEKDIKLKVFKTCKGMVEADILLRYIFTTLQGPDSFFYFRKTFSSQVALSSFLQYVFSTLDCSPEKFIVNTKNAHVVSSDFRFNYNNQGLLKGNDMPFRMTSNIETLIGSLNMEGYFIPVFSSIASLTCSQMKDMAPALHLLLRDDMMSWYASKSAARTDAKTQDVERQLADRVSKNFHRVHERVKNCSLEDDKKGEDNVDPIDIKLRRLLMKSTSPEALCMMDPEYQAWL